MSVEEVSMIRTTLVIEGCHEFNMTFVTKISVGLHKRLNVEKIGERYFK